MRGAYSHIHPLYDRGHWILRSHLNKKKSHAYSRLFLPESQRERLSNKGSYKCRIYWDSGLQHTHTNYMLYLIHMETLLTREWSTFDLR